MHDLRLAMRSLRRNPLVSAVAILSLALGIGANAAMFALFSSVVSRPLPVREPDRLAIVSTGDRFVSVQQYSYATFEQLRSQSHFIEGAFAYTNCCGNAILASSGQTMILERQYVSGDFFTTLGIRPLRGRLLMPADDQRGSPHPVAVISHRLWRDHFGARDETVGSTIVVDRTPLTIVGVTPPDFFGVEVGRSFDIVIPIRLAATLSRTPIGDDTTWLNVVLRLRPGVSLETAADALRGVQPQIRRAAMPRKFVNDAFLAQPLTLEPFASGTSALRRRFTRPLEAIFAVVVLVLLIAAANVGNLLVARGIDRRHDISVRTALGAPRWKLVRQIVIESSLLSAIGAAGGLLLAFWTAPLIVSVLSTAARTIVLDVRPDWRVLVFLVATTAATALLCALAPAIKAMRVAPMSFAKEQGRGAATCASTWGSGVMADVLIVGQVALSMVLLVVGGVFVQTFQRLAEAPLGFTSDGVTIARINAAAVPSAQRVALFERLVNAVTTVPGVVSVGASLNPPLIGELAGDLVVSPPGTVPPPTALRISRLDEISPGWLASYGVPIVAGRDFSETDQARAPAVMLVNEAFVKVLSPDRPILGTTLLLTFRGLSGDYAWGTRTIVGVVADTVHRSARDLPNPAIFIPLSQYPGPLPQTTGYLGIRTAGAAPPSPRAIDDALRTVNGDLAVTYQPLAEQVRDAASEDRLVASLSSGFAILGLILSALGIYGVTAYAAARQRREYGIRIALGASASMIMRRVFLRVALLVGIGLAAGIVASLSGAALLRTLVYGTDPRDPAILTLSALIMIVAGFAAGCLPAYRASRTDPASVLKEA
jgi:putative ABC transport system permease protein